MPSEMRLPRAGSGVSAGSTSNHSGAGRVLGTLHHEDSGGSLREGRHGSRSREEAGSSARRDASSHSHRRRDGGLEEESPRNGHMMRKNGSFDSGAAAGMRKTRSWENDSLPGREQANFQYANDHFGSNQSDVSKKTITYPRPPLLSHVASPGGDMFGPRSPTAASVASYRSELRKDITNMTDSTTRADSRENSTPQFLGEGKVAQQYAYIEPLSEVVMQPKNTSRCCC